MRKDKSKQELHMDINKLIQNFERKVAEIKQSQTNQYDLQSGIKLTRVYYLLAKLYNNIGNKKKAEENLEYSQKELVNTLTSAALARSLEKEISNFTGDLEAISFASSTSRDIIIDYLDGKINLDNAQERTKDVLKMIPQPSSDNPLYKIDILAKYAAKLSELQKTIYER